MTMYTWRKITSSGGAVVYMHVCITKQNFERMHTACHPRHQVYNAMSNKWDLCTVFMLPARFVGCDNDDDKIDYYSDGAYDTDSEDECPAPCALSAPHALSAPCAPSPLCAAPPPARHHSPMMEDSQDRVPPLPLPPRAPSPMMEDLKDDVPGAAPYQFVNTEADNEQVLSEDSSVLLGDNQDVVLNLQYCYGLVLPFRDITANSGQVDGCAWRTKMQVFGFSEGGEECDVSQGDRKVINTFRAAIMGPVDSEIPQDLYDLNDKNFLLLAHLQDFDKVHHITDELVVFTEPQSQACDWFLGVESAEVVLYSRQFLTHAAHGRAALLMGGIVARLAKEYVSVDQALQGPSFEAIGQQAQYMVAAKTDGWYYCDGILTELEIQIVIGLYALQTHVTSQACIKSWFPPPAVWSSHCNGCTWIEWTERNEQWFWKHIEQIHKGEFQPLTSDQWKQKLRRQNTVQNLKKNVQTRAEQFLEKQFDAQDAAFHYHFRC
ncbi:hypothetical protein CVT25_000822 [Psilocybe cyanescens]|uniref:Uncharacterized protein n=1 Tax=Psilocybe cyanescens TaxID=93625 RepID=A0A409XSG4_PSICY|nr:hypothetical protein CVT25_000822 [Psilocybe cyanescens]